MALVDNFDHIVLHFDGNNNDIDDVAAMPVAAALAKSAGIEKKTSLFYGNNISEPSDDHKIVAIRDAAIFVEKVGVKTYTYLDDIKKTTDQLVKILDSGKKVLTIEGGPMEAIYRAIAQTKPANRRNLTLVSHSVWNENRDVGSRPGGGKPRTWADIRADFPEVTQIDIPDQNGRLPTQGFRSPDWGWLDNTTNPVLKEARAVMRTAKAKYDDPSDAGMFFFAITGKETGRPGDARTYFTKNPPSFGSILTPTPAPAPSPDPVSPLDPTPKPTLKPDPTPTPDSGSAPLSANSLIQLALVDAETNKVVKRFDSSNIVLDLKGLDVEEFTLIAQINPNHAKASSVESVKFESNLGNRVENVAPYALFGDKGGVLSGKALRAGEFTIKATAYTEQSATGQPVAATSISYTVANAINMIGVVDPAPPATVPSVIDLSAVEVYGGKNQNPSLVTTLSSNNTALRMEGNGWQLLDVNVSITPQSLLSFDFRSNGEGGIHAIGFDNDRKIEQSDRGKRFQLAGSETDGNSLDEDYVTGSGWQRYDIPVGDYFTGDLTYLTFVNAHDVDDPTAVSEFRNIVLHGMSEPTSSQAIVRSLDLSSADMLSGHTASLGAVDRTNASLA